MSVKDTVDSFFVDMLRPVEYKTVNGTKLTIRTITGDERDKLEFDRIRYFPSADERMSRDHVNFDSFRARHVVAFLGDEHGERIYGDADVKRVGRWPGSVLDEIYELGIAHNGLRDLDTKAAEKNSATVPNCDSGSISVCS